MDLRIQLPRPVAAAVEQVQREDPDKLSRIVFYAMTRHTIFDHLSERSTGPAEEGHTEDA